jgi:hypothetical protein
MECGAREGYAEAFVLRKQPCSDRVLARARSSSMESAKVVRRFQWG